jgi:predicted Zn-dependent protease
MSVRKISIGLTMALFALGGAGCKNTNLLSKDEEIRIGREGSAEIEKAYPVSKNPADIKLVETIGQKLIAANGLTGWPYTFKVLENRDVNAVSLPGGPVYLFRGLLDLTEGNEDELAGVIAHEMSHIEHRHAAKAYSKSILADLLIIFGTAGTATTAADIANMFIQMRFSRDAEYEADRGAIQYAYKAGYDPHGIVRFFEKMKRLERQGRGDIVSNNLRTHPLTDARMDAAKKEIEKTVPQMTQREEGAYLQAQRVFQESNKK